MKALDLFCGLGGWSDGLFVEGFEVLGVEINQEIANLYKHPVICADVQALEPEDFKGYDLIVGSPPCRDFSQLTSFGHRWKIPPDPDKGLELVHCYLNFVKEAEPRFWLMENVPRLEKYLNIVPRATPKLSSTMRRAFWGNYPAFLVPRGAKKLIWHTQGRLRAWERARIPLPVARALGRAVSESTNYDDKGDSQ